MAQYKIVRVPASSLTRNAARLPYTALLLVQNESRSVLDPALHPFNVPGAINDLLGGSGWDRVVQVFKTRVWAPHWTDADLEKFASTPTPGATRSLPRNALIDLREAVFPPPPG